MRAAEIAPAHYLGHLGLPSYPRPAVGPKLKRGKSLYFPQISNKRVPSYVQKSQKQAHPRPKHGPPTRPIPHSYSMGTKTTYPPAAKPRCPPSATPSHHQPPPSSITPEPIPRRCRPPQPQPQCPSRLVVEAEAEPSVPEPVQPRHPVPHHCRSNFATLHRTRTS